MASSSSFNWREYASPLEQQDYGHIFVSVFYDKTEATFLEAAQQVKSLYGSHVPLQNIVINSFKPANIDSHMAQQRSFQKYVFHYIGHGSGAHNPRWPCMILEDEQAVFDPVKTLHSATFTASKRAVLLVLDCCNYIPGALESPSLLHKKGLQLLLDMEGNHVIASSKKGLYSYYYKGVNTLFTRALFGVARGDYENVRAFLTSLNKFLLDAYKKEGLIYDVTGQIIDCDIEFDTIKQNVDPERQAIIKRSIQELQGDAEGTIHLMSTPPFTPNP
jgi:hypothetical protein